MHSISNRGRKRKRLSEASDWAGFDFDGQPIDTKVELIRALIPLGLMAVQEMLEAEVYALAGVRYGRGGEHYRHGTNPGSVKLQGQRHPMRVPRIRDRQGQEVSLSSWAALGETREPDELLLRRVLYGLSCRNYEAAAQALPGAIGLSAASVSRSFVQASRAQLKAFRERDLSALDLVAVFLDGKTFGEDTMVIALGVTIEGNKVPLDFVQTSTENARVLTPFLGSLVDRGLNLSQGLLVIIDGSKGLRSAVRQAFGKYAVVQRCQWHKRENVVAYLSKAQQPIWRQRLQQAYERPNYRQAKAQLEQLFQELKLLNESAAASLNEGLEETLTLHDLGIFPLLGTSFKTTNCLESLNALIEQRCGKVDHWKNSNHKHRWLAVSLMDIEPRLHRVQSYRHLPKLRAALIKALRIETQIQKQAA
ncbi:MAG: transposase [Gammaproteobacteria bacterium]|nr:transposase [Gammaproteobacteria bacterium]